MTLKTFWLTGSIIKVDDKAIEDFIGKCNVVLDDMNFRQFNDHHRNKLITCDGRVGLTAEDAIRVINILETKSK